MSARDDVFANIRRSLHVTGAEAPRRAAVADRLAKTPSGVIPGRGQGGLATFKAEAERAAATLSQIASAAEIPAEIARYLREHNLPATLRVGADPRLAALPWDQTPLELAHGPSDGHDFNAASVAFAGIAETGTLMLPSAPERPTTLNLLADTEIAVLRALRVVGAYEDAWDLLRSERGGMPRNVMLVTGPSRSADIEQALELGAHGPRRLHIVVVGG